MGNKYDWGIYNGVGGRYDFKDKDRNVHHQIMYMLNRTMQMFEYNGLPETIPSKELERMLQTNGFTFITEVEGELYAFNGGLGGEQDVYGKPTNIIVANPSLKFNKTLDLEEDGVLVNNDDMRIGLVPLISKYSTIMNEVEITMILATINKRVNNIISVADDNTAESARQYLKGIENGDMGFIVENKLYDSLKSKPVGDASGSIAELIEIQQYTKASLYNEIGLNSNFNMKKERLISEEVEINSNSIFPLVDNMLSCREKAIEKLNEKYGLAITVEFSSSWKYIDELVSEDCEDSSSDKTSEYSENGVDEDDILLDDDSIDTDVNDIEDDRTLPEDTDRLKGDTEKDEDTTVKEELELEEEDLEEDTKKKEEGV